MLNKAIRGLVWAKAQSGNLDLNCSLCLRVFVVSHYMSIATKAQRYKGLELISLPHRKLRGKLNKLWKKGQIRPPIVA